MAPAKVVRAILLAMVAATCGCTGSPRSEQSGPPEATFPIRLRDVAQETGLIVRQGHEGQRPLNILETSGAGAGFIDADADGDLDVVLTTHSGCRLFLLKGERFEDVTGKSGLPTSGLWQGVAAGDYDNDGWQDLFLAGYHDQRLFQNRKGVFVEVTRKAGLYDEGHWNTSACWTDFDADGHLDLFLCRYVAFDKSSQQFCYTGSVPTGCAPRIYPRDRSVLYRNDGKGSFSPYLPKVFSESPGRSWAVLPADFDGNGWTDFYVANDEEPADLWLNEHGRSFTNRAFEYGIALGTNGRALGGMGAVAADQDGDGLLDLFLTTFVDEPKCLFRSLEKGVYQESSREAGLDPARPYVGWGCAWDDLDNDTRPDLFFVNGHIWNNYQQVDAKSESSAYRQPLMLLRNRDGQHYDRAPVEILGAPLVGRAVASGDYDNDGRIDLLVSDLEGPIRLLHNESPGAHSWVGFELNAKRANRSGLGALVRISVSGKVRNQECRTGGSVFASRDPRVHFGLGEGDTLDWVEVRWPGGGVTRRENVPLNAYSRINQ